MAIPMMQIAESETVNQKIHRLKMAEVQSVQ